MCDNYNLPRGATSEDIYELVDTLPMPGKAASIASAAGSDAAAGCCVTRPLGVTSVAPVLPPRRPQPPPAPSPPPRRARGRHQADLGSIL